MNIELHEIRKRFGHVQANDGISMTISSGIIQGLLGENGAGKTTLMKILSGYQPLDSGRITMDGREVRFSSPAEAIRAGIGMLHQDPLDVPALSVLDNLMLGHREGFLLHPEVHRQELRALCSHLGFALDPDAPLSGLTVGERQQLELVRLLSLGVRVIILDEPTTGISAPQKVRLFETLQQLAIEGLAIVFVSHKLDEIEELCSRSTVLRQGRVAGEVKAPCSSDNLVRLMFGQSLTERGRQSVPLGEVILEMEDVGVETYRLQVKHMTLKAHCSEVIGIAGLEGSGQQLMMRACAGLQPITSGHLLVAGHDMAHQPYARFLEMGIALVPAARLEEGMAAGLSLREHVALVGQGDGFMVDWTSANERAVSLIRAFNIVGRPGTMVQDLSGGNQQRALLALLPERLRVLILEHPTRGLDVESSRWIWRKLLQRRAEGTAILFTSTDLDELVEYSDRLVVFSGGVMSAPVRAGEITHEELGYLIGGRQR